MLPRPILRTELYAGRKGRGGLAPRIGGKAWNFSAQKSTEGGGRKDRGERRQEKVLVHILGGRVRLPW